MVELRDDGLAVELAPPGPVRFEVDADGIIIGVSSSSEAMLGWSASDLIGTPLVRIIPERLHDAHRAGFERFLLSGEMPLEGQRPRLPARHAVIGEIEVELALRKARDDERGVAVGVLELVPQHAARTAHDELTKSIQRSVGAGRPLPDLLHGCIAVAADLHGWVAGTVWWIDPWVDRLRAAATWEREPGSHGDYVDAAASAVLARDVGLVGKVASVGVPTFYRDLQQIPAAQRLAGTDAFRSALYVPLAADDVVVGVVELLDVRSRSYDAGDHEAVWVLADELGRMLAERLRREQQTVQRERVAIALSAGRMGVWSFHPATGIVTWDSHLERMHGFEPGAFEGTLDAFFALVHVDDRDDVRERFRHSLENGGSFEHEFRTMTTSGDRLWVQTASAPVNDADGTLQALTGVASDVTVRVEAARELRDRNRQAALAADVGRALVGSEPLEARLHRTAEAVVEQIGAAFARIWVRAPGSDILVLEASAGMYTHLDGDHARIRIGEYKIGRIAAEREPHLTNDVLTDPLVSDPDWAAREGMIAFAGYPLVVGEQLVGVLGLFAKKALPETSLNSLAAIADTVAIAIMQDWSLRQMESLVEQSRRHATQMEAAMRDRAHVAQVLQRSLLPPSLPEVEGVVLGASYQAGVEEVGGDFYDVIPTRHGWGFMIGDVCGRGPEAARLTALARHSLRTAMLLGHGPADSLATLNDSLLAADTDKRFCTVVCGSFAVLEDSSVRVELAVGGHPLPRLVRAEGTVVPVGRFGSLLGVLAETTHHNVTVELGSGDALVLYTDGVTEAQQADGFFGEERLDEALRAVAGGQPGDIAAAVVAAVERWSSTAGDDMAVLVIGRPHSG